MTPSRRQFMGSLAVGSIASVPFMSEALAQQPTATTDSVLDAIIADFRELQREGDEKPGQRRGVLRAVETLTGVLAAHLSRHYDPDLQRAIRQQLQRKGRQALVQEITSQVNKPEVTHEKVDAALRRLERDGLGGVLREGQKVVRRMRENVPPDYLQARFATQYDFCSDLRWFIELAEMMAAISCAIAAGMLGANALADASCAAATAALAMYLAMKMWYGC